MNHRQRVKAILNYENYDRMPLVHFGYWQETLEKWCREGHLKPEEITGAYDGSHQDKIIGKKLGFDFNWYTVTGSPVLQPVFESKVLERLPNGMEKVLTWEGVIVLQKPGVSSIPPEVGHMLVDRASWEEHYLPRLQFSEDRINIEKLRGLKENLDREELLGIHCTSLFGNIRNWMGVEGISYLYADDEDLYDEIIDTVGNLAYKIAESTLAIYSDFDFGHFWEDICFKNGPLVNPTIFYEKVGPYYKKITTLLNTHGIDIVSLDCDGVIDALIPTWLDHGVNTMFPIEVGVWDASIKPWREKYGRKIRGVGGMNKNVFALDYSSIDNEIERLKPLVELGGYIPCPDHRIPPDARWENVQYYCDRMRKEFAF